ncbi:hypothetical protein LCGC14_3024420, partial [marine sediment metagenome]
MTYDQLSESFGILSDWCDNVEELLSIDENGMTARVNLTGML